ncbi:hypothetical protein, partial [Paracoccus yeei]|uniref:hypothetical protein n=1 Tax=Paracoccus yeei TaxID=147645 RepID=UPI001E4DDDF4
MAAMVPASLPESPSGRPVGRAEEMPRSSLPLVEAEATAAGLRAGRPLAEAPASACARLTAAA